MKRENKIKERIHTERKVDSKIACTWYGLCVRANKMNILIT